MAAHVSAYADSFGNSYASPNASPSWRAPMPPVRYIFVPTRSSHSRSTAALCSASPVRAATSVIAHSR